MNCSTSKKKIKDVRSIPTIIKSKNESVSSENFDFLEEMKKRINPGTFSWDNMDVWVTTYPSLDPYLEVDRTIMREAHPCMGSLTVHAQRPDGKQAHFGIPDFWDMRDLHHNLEFWWKDFEGKYSYDKSIKGHRKFAIEQDIYIEIRFDVKTLRIDFRGRRPNEKVKPKKQRESG